MLLIAAATRPVSAGVLGVGDDAARLRLPPNTDLVSCKDLLIEGRHFFANVSPDTLGHKALAVNLSDLAAMGAKPLACLLGIGLVTPRADWLAEFADGFYRLADQWQCPLIGGDTIASEFGTVISVTVMGTLPSGELGLRRNRGQIDDDLWVSGDLGGADVALRALQGDVNISPELLAATRARLERPEPRVALGQALLPHAHAAIDISDGLTQDLQHLLKASNCGAEIYWQQLPIHPMIQTLPAFGRPKWWRCLRTLFYRAQTITRRHRTAGNRFVSAPVTGGFPDANARTKIAPRQWPC